MASHDDKMRGAHLAGMVAGASVEEKAVTSTHAAAKSDGSTYSYDVFLSHSSADKELIGQVASRLRDDGFRVWYDDWEIRHGDLIQSKIDQGLDESRVLVLFMSRKASESDWVRLEQESVTFHDPVNKNRSFIPVRLDGSDIRRTLQPFKYLNAQSSVEVWYPMLVKTLRDIVGERSGEKSKDERRRREEKAYEDWLEVAARMLSGHLSAMQADCAARVRGALEIGSGLPDGDLAEAILELLREVVPDDPADVAWFDRVIVELERIEKELEFSSENAIRVRTVLDLIFQLGFPRSVLVELGRGLRPGTALASEHKVKSERKVATHVLAELASAYAAQVEPQFVPTDLVLSDGRALKAKGFGQLKYIAPPLGDPEAIVAELLADLALQLEVTLPPDCGVEEMASVCSRQFRVYSSRKSEDEARRDACRFYWVVAPPENLSARERLEDTLETIGKLLPELGIFVVETFAETKDTEEVILQILKDRFVERKRRKENG